MKKKKSGGKAETRQDKAAPPPAPAPRRAAGPLKKLALALVVTLAFFGLVEGVLRVTGFQYKPREKIMWKPTVAGFDGTFEYYVQTYFDPPGYMWRAEPNSTYTDSYGFRNPPIPFKKEPGKVRIAFLGGSTTQGQRHAYPERAVRIINGALGTNRYEALNVGCASYCTHQSLMALQRWVFDRDPDLVCLYHGWNDMAFHDDGYTDAEKDPMFSAQQKIGGWKQELGARLRLVQLLARLIDALDVSWPRPRVPLEQFENNMRSMARLCAKNNKELVVFTRPPLNQDDIPRLTGLYLKMLKMYGTTNHNVAQNKSHEICAGLQRKVAESEPNTRMFDASAVVARLQERIKAGEFGPNAQVFQPDACHLRPLGEQQLAEELAPALAPAHADQIRLYLESPGYQLAAARELMDELMPRESTYYINKVLARDPDNAEAKALLAKAESEIEFADLFWQGCWGGLDEVYESKLAKLMKCLSLRPGDFGVLTQIFRVCIYTDHAGDAAGAMAGFKPATPSDQYGWYRYTFMSHIQAQRWSQAVQYARLCLQMNPNDGDARAFLQQAGAAGG